MKKINIINESFKCKKLMINLKKKIMKDQLKIIFAENIKKRLIQSFLIK